MTARILDEALCRPEFKDLLEETRKRLAPFKHRLSVQPVGGLLLTDADFRTTITDPVAALLPARGFSR